MEAFAHMLGPVFTPVILGVTSIALLYWYGTRSHNYWKEKGIPYIKPIPFFGSLLETFTKPFHEVEIARYKKYGPIYGHYEGTRPVLSIAVPALIKNIMVKDFHAFSGHRKLETGDSLVDNMLSVMNGEDWKRVRTIMTPTFTTGKLKKMMSIFKESADTCAKNHMQYAKEGKPVDLKKVYGAFAMDVVASSAFSTKIDSHNDPNNKFVTTARDLFIRNFSWRFLLLFLAPKLLFWFKIGILPPNGVKFFKDVTSEIIEERKRTGQIRNDFLQLMLDTAKEEDEPKAEVPEKEDMTVNYGKDEINHQIFKNTYKKSLSYDEIVSQCVVFFLGGYDTTTSTLSFASYELAMNPDVQEKLISEIDEVLTASNGQLTYEALQNMKYLDNVISETLRLYPPSGRLDRLADENYALGDTGITIPKGMTVYVPICALHRDPEHFPEPEKFVPDRFSPEERAKRDPFAYMPFGSGPRNCVGMRFSLLEIKVCLATILSQFRIKRCPQTKVPLEFFRGQQLLQPKDVFVEMEPRKDSIAVH